MWRAELFKTIYRQSLAPYVETGKVKLVEHGQWVMRGVRYTIVPGHTPGHSTIEVHSAGERLFVVGDSWFSQVSVRVLLPVGVHSREGSCALTVSLHQFLCLQMYQIKHNTA